MENGLLLREVEPQSRDTGASATGHTPFEALTVPLPTPGHELRWCVRGLVLSSSFSVAILHQPRLIRNY